ncbi:MAG TPA: YjgP/YjgQ family permease [Candidatus Latescibacteria bacterium]|nr:YjgP/YjgQ family permease [Candidatus Latescibacterota bacterium]
MMRLLERYITRQFCEWLIVSLAAFVAIFIVVDLVENLDSFIDRKLSLLDVIRYYILYLPYILVLMLPVAMLLSTLFSVGGLARNNELAAMKASGVSLYRIFYPLFHFAFVMCIFSFLLGEMLAPITNRVRTQIRTGGSQSRAMTDRTNLFLQDVGGQIIFIRYYNAEQKRASRVSIQKYNGASLVKRIDASRMYWKDGGWELQHGKVREFEGEQQVETSFDLIRLTGLTFTPADLTRGKRKPEEMGYFQLRQYIQRARQIGIDPRKWIVDLHLKISFPFANFVVVLFGTSLASTIGRRGRVMGFGLSLLVCFLYYGFIKVGQVLGWNGMLPPLIAAWIGNGTFGTIGGLFLMKVQK